MFTIKHILPSGEELLYESDIANHVPLSVSGRPPSLWIEPASSGGSRFELITGMVYVVNGNGKTVAKYDLGGWPGPEQAPEK